MSSEKEPRARAKLGCRNLAVLSFVGLVWVLISLLALSRAITVGWPAMLSDEGVLALSPFSLALLLLVIIKRDELVTGGATSTQSRHGQKVTEFVYGRNPAGSYGLVAAAPQPATLVVGSVKAGVDCGVVGRDANTRTLGMGRTEPRRPSRSRDNRFLTGAALMGAGSRTPSQGSITVRI